MLTVQKRNGRIEPLDISKIQKYTSSAVKGLENVSQSELEVDAKIQLAYVCSKFMIEPDDVYEATEVFLRPDSYKKLLGVFYDDFPEKYI